jgi:hypothetical protein
MNKHTPGPWIEVDGERFEAERVITNKHRQDRQMVGVCGLDVDFFGEIGLEQKANARLIASAPDLLEALNQVNSAACYASEEAPETREAMLLHIGEIARAAITKATGETP